MRRNKLERRENRYMSGDNYIYNPETSRYEESTTEICQQCGKHCTEIEIIRMYGGRKYCKVCHQQGIVRGHMLYNGRRE